jgi:hypothetical protein
MMTNSKLAARALWPLAFVFMAGALFVHFVGQRTPSPATAAAPLDDWDIPRLVAYLNSEGLGLRAVSTTNGGDIGPTAFLTTTDKGWEELSRLPRGPSHIDRWRGTLFCERTSIGGDWPSLTRQWGDCCLVVGPFFFFGDRELLGRVRAALSELSQPEDRSARSSTALSSSATPGRPACTPQALP